MFTCNVWSNFPCIQHSGFHICRENPYLFFALQNADCFQLLFQTELMKELGKSRIETDSIKRQMLQQEIAFNIQQTDALTR